MPSTPSIRRATLHAAYILVAAACCARACEPAAAADAEKLRVAVIASGQIEQTLADSLSAFEAALAKTPDVEVISRAESGRILNEQKLAFTDAVTSTQAVDAGRWLKTDLFLVVRQTPGNKSADEVGVVVLDGRRGVRLADRSLAGPPQKVAAELATIFKQSLAKIRPGDVVTRIVSVVGVRNVDLGPGRDSQCAGFVEVLERDLVNSPRVIVLDRSHMELIGRPQALASDEGVKSLLASTLRLDVQFSQAPDNQIEIDVVISDARQRSKKVTRRMPAKELSQGNLALRNEVLQALKLAVPVESFDRAAEARRLVTEAVYQAQQKSYERSLRLTEAAYALSPDEPSLTADFLRLMRQHATILLWKSEDPYAPLGPLKCTAEEHEKAADLVVRGLEIALRRREQEEKQGGVRLRFLSDDWQPYGPEDSLTALISHLKFKAVESTETGRALAKDAQLKARQLHVNLIMNAALRNYGQANSGAHQIGFWVTNARRLPMFCDDWDEWLRLLILQQTLALEHLASVPPTPIKHSTGPGSKLGAFSQSYVELLHDAVPPSPKDAGFGKNEINFFHYPRLLPLATSKILTASHYQQLGGLYQTMANHKLAGVRIVGLGGRLWTDFHLDAITAERLLEETKTLRKQAEQWIADPGLAGEPAAAVNAERVACYEAMLFVIDILGRVSPDVRPQRDALLNFMLGRKEVVTSAVWSAAGANVNYLKGESISGPTLSVFPYHYADHEETREALAEKLKPIRELLKDKNVKVLDGGRSMIDELLRRAIPETKRPTSAPGRPNPPTPPAPWKQAVPLLLCHERPFMFAFSQPVVDGDHLYVVGTSGTGAKFRQELFQISLVDRSAKIIGSFDFEVPAQEVPNLFRYGPMTVQGRPALYGDRVYVVINDGTDPAINDASARRVEGIVGLSTRGEPALRLRPASHPDMATSQIDAVAVLDDGLLALSSGTQTSYVLWFDFKKQTWETIAASNRAQKKTLLDYPELYLPKIVVDPHRHRLLFTLTQLRGPPQLHCGLFEFNTQTRTVKKLFAFPHNGPSSLEKMTDDTLWVTFSFFDGPQRTFEMNLTTHEWELILTRVKHKWCEVDGKPFDDEKKGPARGNRNSVVPKKIDLNKPRYAGSHLLGEPYVVVDGAVWTSHPFTRVAPDGKKSPLPPVSEKIYEATSFAANDVTMTYLEHKNAVLYGTADGVWLLEMPESKSAK